MCEQFFGGQGGGPATGNPFAQFIQGLEQRAQQARPQPIVPRVQNAQPSNPAAGAAQPAPGQAPAGAPQVRPGGF